MYAALLAGSIAAIVDALVSLPLRSPDDALFNSATVVVGALLSGVAAGAVWRLLANSRNRRARFALIWTLCFVPVAALAVFGDTQLDRFASFALPLIVIAFGLTGTLTIAIARTRVVRWWLAPAAVVLALAVGIGFAGRGDERSGRLELPPRAGLIEWSEGAIEIADARYGVRS
jgi:4-amino-4-deoxy-L-arabinose transferase-like glycosyltransferase